jgi:cell division protein FtsL
MTNRAILLLAMLMLCSLTLVNAQYQARRLFIELEHAQARQRELEIAWAQLQLEQSLLAKHARIETQAKNVLNMMVPGENRTQYLTAGEH